MRFATCAPFFTLTMLVSLPTHLAGCSSAASTPSKPAPTVPDASVYVPPPATSQRGPITVIVKGHGEVISDDGSFACGENGGLDGGTCQPPHVGVTFYATPLPYWVFDHWEPRETGLSEDSSYKYDSWTVDPLTAVFVPGWSPEGGAGGGD
jgi:hypothetical protein